MPTDNTKLVLALSNTEPTIAGDFEVSFSTNLPAIVYYTLDSRSPLCPNAASIWNPDSPIKIEGAPSRQVNIKAIAYNDTYISNQIDHVYDVVNPNEDADSDGILNSVEMFGPDGLIVDTDKDDIPDYLDTDSDNDGISDALEGTEDYNNDGIPNYRDPEPYLPLVYSVEIVKEKELAINHSYKLLITTKNGSGKVTFNSVYTKYLYSPYIDAKTNTFELKPYSSFELTFMPSVCSEKEIGFISFMVEDNYTPEGEEPIVREHYYEFNNVMYSEKFPEKGIKISWKKYDGAESYNIYRVNDVTGEYTKIAEIPHDYISCSATQWYVDTDGSTYSLYSVSYNNVEGKESSRTLPKHAPDVYQNKCLVQGNITSVGLDPVQNVVISYKIKEIPNRHTNTIIAKYSDFTYTDSRGNFEFTAPQHSVINLSIDSTGFFAVLAIPDKQHVDISELLNKKGINNDRN